MGHTTPPGDKDTLSGYLEPELQDQIGIQLRKAYNEIVEEPVPDRFLQLLEELERAAKAKS